jgi:antitoxin component of MazEF toxin-antitoxin module
MIDTIKNRTTLRKVGNSKGLLLSKEVLEFLSLEVGNEISISLESNKIVLQKVSKNKNQKKLNLKPSTWEAQFKKAITNGEHPENDVFEGMNNQFDKTW